MKVMVIYRPISEHARPTEDWLHEFARRYPATHVETLSIDSREGSTVASIYDIVDYPGVLALTDDGSALSVWQGAPLPLVDEVAGYLRS